MKCSGDEKTANQRVTAPNDAWPLSKAKVFLHAANSFMERDSPFQPSFKKEGGCKFNPECCAVYRIWTDTLAFPLRKSWKTVNAQ